jgi:hypothetical protein
MGAVGVASDVAFATPSRILASKRKHLAAVAAPVRANVCEWLKAMRDAVIDLLFVFLRRNKRQSDGPERSI